MGNAASRFCKQNYSVRIYCLCRLIFHSSNLCSPFHHGKGHAKPHSPIQKMGAGLHGEFPRLLRRPATIWWTRGQGAKGCMHFVSTQIFFPCPSYCPKTHPGASNLHHHYHISLPWDRGGSPSPRLSRGRVQQARPVATCRRKAASLFTQEEKQAVEAGLVWTNRELPPGRQ